MERTLVGELMDDPRADPAELTRALGYIRWINSAMGGTRALLRHLSAWSRAWPRGRTVTMLDVGTGSADIPRAVVRWGAARGHRIEVTGIDLHDGTLAEAARVVAGTPGITLRRADALRLNDIFTPGSFDYCHAGMFLHHLPDPQVRTVLASMARVARAGVVWYDLVRSPLHARLVNVLLIGQGRMVQHDARASVAAGFTRAEVEAMAGVLKLDFMTYHQAPLWYRFTLAGERPGSWGA